MILNGHQAASSAACLPWGNESQGVVPEASPWEELKWTPEVSGKRRDAGYGLWGREGAMTEFLTQKLQIANLPW
jgi:hypothetical protein